MSRTARVKSSTDVYHIMLRGVNRQQIFFDDEDNYHFIHLLESYKEISQYQLYAYCLMGNHVHLLLRADGEPLETIFRRIGSAYVYWYNTKYERVGHLFQDRYKSEPVNDERYFLTVLRYILQNPVKAGFCNLPEEYPFSSAWDYLLPGHGFTDTEFVFQLIDRKAFRDFLKVDNEAVCMDITDAHVRRWTDSAAKELIIKEFETLTPLAGGKVNREELEASIQRLLSKGLSIRQISRLAGVPRKIIERASKSRN